MSVHIKISDRNWILEVMARNLADRLNYVSYDTEARLDAQIQYYLTYSTFKGRVSPIELAYFTHLEEDAGVKARFFAAAEAVDGSVCMSEMYADMLRQKNVRNVHVIPPGVDLQTFDVKLRIGVVGRTYVTGRKGEALVAEVLDTPGIEWLFTGDGWPGPALNLADGEMPGFYRSLDYVLVPARYEGGPMSAIEALASGVEVIAPDVGWMPELPHIAYKRNDAADLRRVLTGLVQKRRARREAVLQRSWDNYAQAHDVLFRKLLGTEPKPVVPGAKLQKGLPKVHLVTHGAEKVAKGGPSTRIPQLRDGLPRRGYEATQVFHGSGPLNTADLFHLFNVATPKTAERAMRSLRSFARPIVFSPIYLDNRCRSIWSHRIPEIFRANVPFEQKILEMDQVHREGKLAHATPVLQDQNLPLSYHQGIARILRDADELIYLSKGERDLLSEATGVVREGTVVPNPVSSAAFRNGDPELFCKTFNIRDFVLCVGRIEPRKNQLALAAALSGTGIPLVLIGESFDAAYMDMIRGIPDLQLIETGRIEAGSEMLASAFAACRVFCLPSWSEGAPIAALEAGAAGCRMVLSTMSAEAEYFGDLARYADPGDVPGLRGALREAFDEDRSTAEIADYVAEQFSVERHAAATAAVYDRALSHTREHVAPAARAQESVAGSGGTVYIDLTSIMNHPGRITGITRVELSVARSVVDTDDVRFIAWHGAEDYFFHVDPAHFSAGGLPHVRDLDQLEPVQDLPRNAPLVAIGNGWLRNKRYLYALERLTRSHELRLLTVVYDILPISQPQFFEAQQKQDLEDHLERLAEFSNFCTESAATRLDMETFFAARKRLVAPIELVRLGDDLRTGLVGGAAPDVEPSGDQAMVEKLVERGHFVLSVGSQFPHKNRRLVFQVWNKLVEDLGTAAPTLVIVGKSGDSSDMQALAQATRSKVVIIPAVSDAGLAMLYEHCLFTVFPSLCEGWGLPVAESLLYGKICVSSDRYSMPEIAPRATDLIDPFDTMAWYRRIKLYATSKEARARREAEILEKFQPVSWRATLNRLLTIARNTSGAAARPGFWDLETVFDFTNPEHCALAGLAHRTEDEGRREVTSLSFGVMALAHGAVVMRLKSECTSAGTVEVWLNGRLLETIALGRTATGTAEILIPASLGAQALNLEFRAPASARFRPVGFVIVPLLRSTLSLPRHDLFDGAVAEMGKIVRIDRNDRQLSRIFRHGWHTPERERIWSKRQAEIWIPLEGVGEDDLVVSFKASLFRQSLVYVRVGQDFVTCLENLSAAARTAVELTLPAWILARAGTHLRLEFEIPRAIRPSALGYNTDARELGLQVSNLKYSARQRVSAVPSPGRAAVTQFQNLLGRGWHAPEGDHVWSAGDSELTIPASRVNGQDIVLRISTLTEQTLQITAGKAVLTSVALERGKPTEIRVALSELANAGETIRMLLEPSRVASPASLGLSSDARELGICLHDILLAEHRPSPSTAQDVEQIRRSSPFWRFLKVPAGDGQTVTGTG